MRKVLLLLLLIVPNLAHAQGTQIVTLAADPPTCNTGMTYVNSGTNTLRVCGPNNTWSNTGGISNTVPPAATYFASPNCPVAGTNNCNFVFDDGYVVATDVTTNSSTTITCPNNDCNFTTINQPQFGSTIVGMQAWVVQTSTVATSPVPVCPMSTITAVNSAQSITVTTTCTGNLTTGGTLVIGHKDDTNLSTAWTNTGCGTLQLPDRSANPIAPVGTQAVLLTSIGQFQTRPSTGCNNGASNGMYGDPNLIGSAIGTTLVLTPDFAFTSGNCAGTTGSAISGSYNVCFGPQPVMWYGIDIVGFGFASCGTATLVLASAAAGGVMELSNHNNICVSNANLIGAFFYGANYRFVYGGVQNVGGVAARAPAAVGLPVYSNTNFFINNQSGTGNTLIGLQVDAGAILVDHSSIIGNALINGAFTGEGTVHATFNGSTGLNATELNSSTAVMNCTGCTFNAALVPATGVSSPGSGSSAINLNASGSVANIQGTTFWQSAPSSGHYLVTAAGSKFNDLGGNVCPSLNSGAAVNVAGVIQTNASLNYVVYTSSINTNFSSTSITTGATCALGTGITVYINAFDSAAGTGCSGNTTVTWTVSYTDPFSQAQTATATETITGNGNATGGDQMRSALAIWPQADSTVNISTTYSIGSGCSVGPKYSGLVWTKG